MTPKRKNQAHTLYLLGRDPKRRPPRSIDRRAKVVELTASGPLTTVRQSR